MNGTPETPSGTGDEAESAAQRPHPNRDTTLFAGTYVKVDPLPDPAPPIQLPTIDASDDLTRNLAAAAVAARTSSAAQLDTWFPGYSFLDASQISDDRRFTVLNLGDALFEHLDGVESVERLITQQNLVAGQLRFSHGEKKGAEPNDVLDPLHPRLRRLRVGPLVNSLDNQWTTILNGIDLADPATAAVCEHIERVTGARVNTNVYISYGHALGFGQHWDNHDTIIVPATGAKKWRVFEPVTLSPQRPWVNPEVSDRPVWEGAVEPGMCLVIPRGWGHEVQGSDELSIHYTIGVTRLTFADVMQRVSLEAGFNPLVRADVAYSPGEPVHSYAGSLHDEGSTFSELVAELTTPELVDRAIATFRARCPMRLRPRLFDMWAAATTGEWEPMSLRMPVPMGLQLIGKTPEATALAVDGKQVTVTAAATDLLVALADTQSHRIADLPLVNGDTTARAAVCSELLRAGLIDVRYR